MNVSSFVVCFGELLIDMIATNTGDPSRSRGFLKKFGGAPANTAIGLAKLGVPVAFIGKVGDDPFGHFLKRVLKENGVRIEMLLTGRTERTTLAFVSLTETGERDFFFYRGAHEAILPSEVNLPPEAFLLHLGSLTQIKEAARKATDKLIDQAQRTKVIVSYDPNIRKSLWNDLKKAREIILETAKRVNILKLNLEETVLLTNTADLKSASKKLFTNNLDALFITLGLEGCYYKTKNNEGKIPTIKAKTVDTTGAGDAFNAGYIWALYQSKKKIPEMTKGEIESTLWQANVIATLTTTKKGAITALPTKRDIEKFPHFYFWAKLLRSSRSFANTLENEDSPLTNLKFFG